MERNIEYTELGSYLDKSTVRNVLLLPDTNGRIEQLFKDINSSKKVISVKNMEEAVDYAFKLTEKNKICLLSPAAASYNMYKNFEERGDHFKQLVSK